MELVNTPFELLRAIPGDRTAIVIPEQEIKVSYDWLQRQVFAVADALAALGVRREDRIAMVLPNGLSAIVCFLAASMVGTAAPLNPGYRYEEFCFFLRDTNARLLLCPPHGAEEARRAAGSCIPVFTAVLGAEGTVYLHGVRNRTPAPAPLPEEVALILHTSGSTGQPKRVPLRHRNLAVSAQNIAGTYGLAGEDVSLCVMPLFHIHGLVASTLATLISGGTVVVPSKFNPLAFWRLVREYQVTWYSAVPTIHQLLLARAGGSGKPSDAGTLRFIRSASTPLAPEVMHKMEAAFGVPVVEAYGMTEAAHQMAANPLPPAPRKPGSVGLPSGTIRISIMDEHGNHLETGERGEVVIQGANVFDGYENSPEANARSFVNGWFRTGDQGLLDSDGYLHLTGRLKELINRGGEKIAPRVIDEVLLSHPAVSAAVTFGFPHSLLGEEVAAAVVLREPEKEAALLAYCRERLADFECPKKLYIVDSIPQTATGKIKRGEVATIMLRKKVA
jgi:acyl-CoA synthetase (AMP-forming)/AMP-acid ligase II